MDDSETRRRWTALLHRWLIEHNPLYLVSAALVLTGMIVLSRELAQSGGVAAQLGIGATAEIYAWALVGSAALLVRIRLRRPAVMLALLAAFYQCDPTLHTATCAYLGVGGAIGSALWLLGFGAKLRALAWALQLRLSRSAMVLPIVAAAGLAGLPWLLRELDGRSAEAALAAWTFGMLAAGLWSTRRIDSRVALEAWPSLVARRSIHAVWIGWAAMLLLHVAFLASQHPGAIRPYAFASAALLLMTRWLRGELATWSVVAGTLAWTSANAPEHLGSTAAMAAVVLGLRALRRPEERLPTPLEPLPSRCIPVRSTFAAEPRFAMIRLLTGAGACAYLAVWTHGWPGGPWPEHLPWLDALIVLVGALAARRRLGVLPLVPGTATIVHLVVSRELVPAPQSALQWGATCVALGFGLLVLSLVASLHYARGVRRRWLDER